VPGGDPDRLVEVLAVEDVEPGDPLLGLRERPSVTRTSPLVTWTVVASLVGRSRSPVTRVPAVPTSSSHSSIVMSSSRGVASASGSTTTNIMYFMDPPDRYGDTHPTNGGTPDPTTRRK
jgi:hypothetical protein